LINFKGEEVTASYRVQSVRAVVEQTIGDLKRAKVMNDNKISTAATMEKVLDCVIALHNLRVLCKVNPDFELPARRAALPDEHIIKRIIPKNEVDLKIPADKPNLSLPDLRHIRDFVEFLPSAVGAISKATERGGNECIFYPNVRNRGFNLYKGAYVLQLRVQHEGLDVWTVKYHVGASYSFEVHVGYFKISRDNAGMGNICDCNSG
jgi:hypothetical protein